MPLTLQNYNLFMDTYRPLLHFAGIKHGLIGPKTSYKSFLKSYDFSLKFECRQKLYTWKN